MGGVFAGAVLGASCKYLPINFYLFIFVILFLTPNTVKSIPKVVGFGLLTGSAIGLLNLLAVSKALAVKRLLPVRVRL